MPLATRGPHNLIGCMSHAVDGRTSCPIIWRFATRRRLRMEDLCDACFPCGSKNPTDHCTSLKQWNNHAGATHHDWENLRMKACIVKPEHALALKAFGLEMRVLLTTEA